MTGPVWLVCVRHPKRARVLGAIGVVEGDPHGTDLVRWSHTDPRAFDPDLRHVTPGKPLRLDCPQCIRLDLGAASIPAVVDNVTALADASAAVAVLPGNRVPLDTAVTTSRWVDVTVVAHWLRTR